MQKVYQLLFTTTLKVDDDEPIRQTTSHQLVVISLFARVIPVQLVGYLSFREMMPEKYQISLDFPTALIHRFYTVSRMDKGYTIPGHRPSRSGSFLYVPYMP